MEFQIYDYLEGHEKQDESDEESDSDTPTLPQFIIHVFGRTLDGKSVYCKLKNFTPHFYIKLPSKWTKREAFQRWKLYYGYDR